MDTNTERFITGDSDALQRIFLEQQARLLASAYGQCRDRELSQDAVQDVFEKLCRMEPAKRLEYFGREDSNLEAWLRVAVRHRVQDILKVRANREKKDDDNCYAVTDRVENGVRGRLSQQGFSEMLGQLQFRQREVMELHMAGYRNEEIANMLRITYNTVKNNIYEARQRLRRLWPGYME